MVKALYKIWDWYEAPYNVITAAPWKKGTWIVRVEREGDFPYHEIDFRKYGEWEVEEKIVNSQTYYFIKNPNYIPWPPWHPSITF